MLYLSVIPSFPSVILAKAGIQCLFFSPSFVVLSSSPHCGRGLG